jgi:hypothetical protein
MTTQRQGVGNMPAGVAFVAVLTMLNGFLTLALGAMWLWLSGDADLLGDVDTTADDARLYGWTSLALGAIITLVAFGLFSGSRFARFLVMTLMVLRIGIEVFALIALEGYSLWQASIGIAWAALIVIMLTTRPASRFFLQR